MLGALRECREAHPKHKGVVSLLVFIPFLVLLQKAKEWNVNVMCLVLVDGRATNTRYVVSFQSNGLLWASHLPWSPHWCYAATLKVINPWRVIQKKLCLGRAETTGNDVWPTIYRQLKPSRNREPEKLRKTADTVQGEEASAPGAASTDSYWCNTYRKGF